MEARSEVGVILTLSGICGIFYIRFSNPNMTEMRLFLDYLPHFVGFGLATLIGAYLWGLTLKNPDKRAKEKNYERLRP